MMTTVRFAPSPTGHIHIGNSRTALFNWLFAKKSDGKFILRFDDTDTERSRAEYADAIAADLQWLGITPDRIERQSSRVESYDTAAQKLKDAGLLYACYETPDELERRRSRARALGRPPVYDRAGLKLTDDERAALEAEGRRPHWRFVLPNHDGDPFTTRRTEVSWTDLCRGDQSVDLASLSDPVLIREDGSYLYTLPSIVDDIDMGVTHVIRGEDHVANTGVQVAIFEALGAPAPVFAHHNLLTTRDGEGLSKRKGALSIGSLRDAGLEPMSVASLAVLTGTSHSVEPMAEMAKLAEAFDLASVSRSSAKFDPEELNGLNARLVHEMPFADVEGRLANLGIAGGETFWLAVRGNCVKVSDAQIYWQVVVGPIESLVEDEDRDFLVTASKLLPEGDITQDSWGAWTSAVKAETGRKGKGLFMPLRKALTGLGHGPDMKDMLPLIGRQNIRDRLP
ncbi:glutamyl-tRNA synthetase [Roseibium hamelinense]|uniref:Glutamate--tRNA ligase n=1 Tax=Roseibium hamelinense TaxID=150831 RepID=A0A562T7Q9_9HYPH|nr:glutamate--tRNA ligase [Roseibium hamelinense]MTI43539.1 glutamate--tRNA ligase [Roseibium hamelinense]TWI89667.1 glutamyl-tRNA synthetase [Roseibium hamelinense]